MIGWASPQLGSCKAFNKGAYMAYKPNYGLQRADRNRAAQARSEQKQRKREEKSAHRKAERAAATNLTMRRHNEEMPMNAAESKSLKKGSRVYWLADSNDGGIVTEMSWDAVTIAWDNGHV